MGELTREMCFLKEGDRKTYSDGGLLMEWAGLVEMGEGITRENG